MRFIRYAPALLALTTLGATPAHARDIYDYGERMLNQRMLTVGSGFSSPSATVKPGENPAGLAEFSDTAVDGTGFADESQLNPLGLDGNFYFGNGSVGGRLGAQHFSNADTFNAGLAASASSLNLEFGASATWTKDPGADVDLGVLYSPSSNWRVGATALGVVGGPDGYAGGVATDLSPSSTFAVDASVDQNGNGLRVRPALGITASEISLTIGYGIKVDDQFGSAVRDGFGLGLGFKVGTSAEFKAYYNTIVAKYLAEVTLRL